jgi:hypothetical protein
MKKEKAIEAIVRRQVKETLAYFPELTPKTHPPRRSEWDFSRCSAGELLQCFLYEYARESWAFRTGFEAWRATIPKGDVASVQMACWEGAVYVLRSDCREFPEQPWLEISPDRRAAVIQTPYRMDEAAFERGALPIDRAIPARNHHLNIDLGLDPVTGREKGVFEICWGWPNEKIIADFTKWLQANRPDANSIKKTHGIELEYGGADVFGRGKSPDFDVYLKELGAYRLLKYFTADEAMAFTEKERKGPSLYGSSKGWSEAKTNAEKHLSSFTFKI